MFPDSCVEMRFDEFVCLFERFEGCLEIALFFLNSPPGKICVATIDCWGLWVFAEQFELAQQFVIECVGVEFGKV